MNIDTKNNREPRNNRAFAGLFLIALGGFYLLNQVGWFLFPGWLFSWPVLLVIVGVLNGIKHNFRNPAAYILIILGGIFLIGHIVNMALYLIWPVILIAIGVHMVTNKNDRRWCRNSWEQRSAWAKHTPHDASL